MRETPQIKNLHADVEEKNILKGIDLAINAGKVHAIVGRMAAAKEKHLAKPLQWD